MMSSANLEMTHVGRLSRIAVTASMAIALASCAGQQHVTTTTTHVEETLTAPAASGGVSIVNLHAEPAENTSFVNVTGTVVNDSSALVSPTIRVDMMDTFEQVMDSVETQTLPQTIAPNGGQAQFSVRMENTHLTHFAAFVVAR
jgi:hypothetical protein